jgi:hypothetical protein
VLLLLVAAVYLGISRARIWSNVRGALWLAMGLR